MNDKNPFIHKMDEQLKNKSKTIKLDNMKIKDEDIMKISNYLLKIRLKSFSLKKNWITDAGVELMASTMSKINVSVLDLSSNKLSF